MSAEFVACMEDVLDLYAEPYDPKRPVVCFPFSAPDVPALFSELESEGVPVAAPREAWTNAQRSST